MSAAIDRTPPHDHAAEQAVLGAMMLSASACHLAIAQLDVDDFHRPAHRVIYKTIAGLRAAGHDVDQIVVRDALTRSGKLEEVGGAVYLLDLSQACTVTSNVPEHAGIVKRQSVLRALTVAGVEDRDHRL